MWYNLEAKWTVVYIILLVCLCNAQQMGVQSKGVVKYPINMRLTEQYLPRFEASSAPRRYHSNEDYPPCKFNTQCICSNTGPDLGLVFCDDVELGRVPKDLNNTKMHTLTLRSNQLRIVDELSFYGTGMYRLEISRNLLLDLPERAFSGVERSLWELDLSHNKLSKVPTKMITKLKKLSLLDLTGNYISDISAENFRGMEISLKTLVLAENSIVSLPEGLIRSLENLRTLNLRGNNIYFINERAFHGASSRLNHLNFENNLLKEIPFEALREVHNLQILNLARNRIKKTFKVIFSGFLFLDTLILDLNEIESLPPYAFQNFQYINYTSLRGNPILDIYNDAFKDAKIKELYLHDCELGSISETAFRGLESSLQLLDLSYNNLSTLPEKIFKNFDDIRSLSLSNNRLSMDPKTYFNGFKHNLQNLNLLGENMGNFPIESLKEIRNVRTLGLSTLSSTVITKDDFTGFGPAVEKLYLLNNGITYIAAQAFEHVPGVKILDLSYNGIRSLDNEAFAYIGGGLETLRISSGLAMTSLPPQPMLLLSNLKELDLSNNRLSYVERECFRNMRNLRTLNLQDNKIKRLSQHHFQGQFHPDLESVQLSFNSIGEIESSTFHDCRKLRHIYLEDNIIRKVSGLAFSNLEYLETLYLQGNNIKELSQEAFQNIPKLRYLDLSYNEMTNLNLDAFEQVGTLSTLTIDASYNKIASLRLNGTNWNSYSGIKIIIFSNNNISSISTHYFESIRSSVVHMWFEYNNLRNVSGEIFQHMPHLKLLSFAHNHIEFIDQFAFKDTVSLQYVKLCHNQLIELSRNIFEGQKSLRHIDISFNLIRRMSEDLFADSPLEIFKGRHNRFRNFPDSSLLKAGETLRVIDLAYNEIIDLTDAVLGRFSNLVSLDLSHNRIKTIESRAFHNLWRLLSLDVSSNPIKNIERYTLNGLHSNLHNLSMANTSLESLPDLEFPNLVELNISNNKITYLPAPTFANLTTLRVLDASHNEIMSPSGSVWQGMPRLRHLELQYNPIRALSNDSFMGLGRLEYLDIRQLPLQSFQSGSIAPLESLRELSITTQPLKHRFNIARSLAVVPSLQKLTLEIDGDLDYQLKDYPLPFRLANLSLTGQYFRKISFTALQMLNSRELTLTIYKSSLNTVPWQFFRNLGRVRFLALAVLNNSLEGLGNPSSTHHPGEPNSVFLTDLKVDGNKWRCDCGIGWIESWIKLWHQTSCSLESHHQCEESLRSLRRTKCEDRGRKSLMEAFKRDLECGDTSSATSLSVYSWTICLTYSWSHYFVNRILY